MRWTSRISAVLLVAWILYGLSPFLALYRLERAVQAHDTEAVRQRLNLRALRLSLLRQAVEAVLASGLARDLDPAQRQLATEGAMTFAEPLVARLLTPEAIIDLLDDGWPQSLAPERTTGVDGLKLGSLGQVWRVYLHSESRGFRTVVIVYPPGRPAERQFRLRLRLSGGTWRLVAIDLPAELRQRFVREFEEGRAR